jgi:hypothetical protein
MPKMTPAEYGRHLASLEPPITDEQARETARILLSQPEDHPTVTGRV